MSQDLKVRARELRLLVEEMALERAVNVLCGPSPLPPVAEGHASPSLQVGGMGNTGINGALGMCPLGSEAHEHHSLSLPKRSSKVEFCGWRWPRVSEG